MWELEQLKQGITLENQPTWKDIEPYLWKGGTSALVCQYGGQFIINPLGIISPSCTKGHYLYTPDPRSLTNSSTNSL
jgi:hypothetical protein